MALIPAAFAAKHGSKLIAGGAALLLLILVLSLTYCAGRKDGKTGEVVEQQERTIELQQDAAGAASTAADERLEDTVTIAEQKKELDDAIKAAEDPATLRIRRGCLVMRQQHPGAPAAPACRRYEAGN